MVSVLLFLAVLGACAVQSHRSEVVRLCHPCKCHEKEAEITADCTDKGLYGIPGSIPDNITNLDMKKNNVSELPANNLTRFHSLRVLDFSKNNLSSLGVDSLVGARALRKLILHGNFIPLNDKAYPNGVFRQQKQLVTLDVSKNVADTQGIYPDEALSDLVSLQNLYIDGIENATFGQGFAELEKLTTLSLSGYCAIYNLFNHSFDNTPYLKLLAMRKCRILDIEINAFASLKSIDTLDLSENVYFGFDKFGDSLYGLRFSPLRVLKINRIVNKFAIGVVIEERHFRYFKDMNVKELYADNNRIELMRSMVQAQFAGCEIISVKNGRFTYGEYLLALDTMTNLSVIYFNDQYISAKIPVPGSEQINKEAMRGLTNKHTFPCGVTEKSSTQQGEIRKRGRKAYNSKEKVHGSTKNPYYTDIIDKEEPTENSTVALRNINPYLYDLPTEMDVSVFLYQMTIPLPPNVTFVSASNSKLNYELFEMRFTKNRLKHLDLSTNMFTRWIGPFHETQNLEYLDMSSNYCEEIAPTFLKFATGLKVLNISKNFLATSLRNDSNGQLFFNQTNLEILRIAQNIIQILPMSIFSRLKKLKVLDLSWNMMETWTTDISHMTSLQNLDLAKNRLEVIPRNLRKQIDTIMKNRQDTFNLSINTNYLKCNCESLQSLQWMLKPHITIDDLSKSECWLPDGSKACLCNLEDIVLGLQQKCKTSLPIILSTAAGLLLFLTVAVAGIIYRYRWKLRYLYYTTRRKYRGYQRLTEEHNFTFDAFVSYADEDRDFVVNDMRVVLEERLGLKLCIHQRDFMVGEPITANIINAIQSSRKTIAVLSPDFVASSWCEYEVRMAKLESIHTGRDLLCVVWYADVPDRGSITGNLLEEILNDTYIKYPREEEDQELFWTTLKQSLEY